MINIKGRAMFDKKFQQPQPVNKRGAVGIMTDNDEAWLGVFIGKGSNPLAFGNQLWTMLQENWQCLDRWGKALLECGYWEEFLNDRLCPYCGHYDVGQPHNVSGRIIAKCQSYGPHSIAPDPHSLHHSHLAKMPTVISTNEVRDGLWVEWAYVLDPKTHNLSIFKSVMAGGFFLAKQRGRKWKQPKFRYYQIETFMLHGGEPDWAEIERRGLSISKYYHDKCNPQNQCGEVKR